MSLFSRFLSLKVKFALLIGLFVSALLGFGFVSGSILKTVMVNGPLYGQIIQNKDLLADVLPPPAFCLEAYLVAHQMREAANSGELNNLSDHLRQLKEQYQERLAFWSKTLAPGEMRDELLGRTRSTAESMLQAIELNLLPALRAEQPQQAERIFSELITPKFVEHRASIDRIAKLAAEAAAKTEADTAVQISRQQAMLFQLRVAVVLSCCGIACWLCYSIVHQLRKLHSTVESIANGMLDQSVDVTSTDELGQLAAGINSLLASLRESQSNSFAASENQAIKRSQMVLELAFDGIILHANEKFTDCFGYTLEELKGRPHTSLLEQSFRADSGYLESWQNLKHGRFQEMEYSCRAKDGHEIIVKSASNPIYDGAGRPVKIIQFLTDVTEAAKMRDANALYASMSENSPINIMYADRDLKLKYMNPAAINTLKKLEKLLPVSVDRMLGQSIDIFHKNPAYQRNLLSDPKNLPRSAQIAVGSETLDLLVSPIYDGNKKYLGAMATWSIITEKLVQERREQDLTENLSQILNQVAMNSSAMAAAAEELSAVSSTMSANAEETSIQSGAVSAASEEVSRNTQTVAASIEEMSASIKEIAKNAVEAAKVATVAVTVAQTTNATISKLGESSQEIGNVMKAIRSIAQQTNLLALNATIEAARAGEAGKGFAVVANEVKELAKETAKATEDISQRIEAIQQDSHGAIQAIDQISSVINQINDISSTIASAVEEQTATTSEIGRSVAEASRGTSEIAQNITSVAQAARSTTEGASNSNCAAQEVARMAAQLQELVSQFHGQSSSSFNKQPSKSQPIWK